MNGKVKEVETKSDAANDKIKMLGRYARMLGSSILSHFRQIGWAGNLLIGMNVLQGELMVKRLALETAEAWTMKQWAKAILLGGLTADAQIGLVMAQMARIDSDRNNQYIQEINEMRDTYS